jgi:hypothetical protein
VFAFIEKGMAAVPIEKDALDGPIPLDILARVSAKMASVRPRFTFAAMDRMDGRTSDQLRPVAFDLGIAPYADGSVLVMNQFTSHACCGSWNCVRFQPRRRK